MRRHRYLAAGVALLTLSADACRQGRNLPKPLRPVKVQTVEPHVAEPRDRYSANIEAYEQINLALKDNGYVTEIRQTRGADGRMRNIQPGDHVTRGMILARVREDDYVEAVNRAKAVVAQAEAALQKATLDYERAKRLFATDSITKPDYDSAKAQYEGAQAQKNEALASLAGAEIHLRDTALVAPSNGVILNRSIEVGTLVGPGSMGFTIADVLSVKATFGVPDQLVKRARLGITLPITTEVFGTRQFLGKITSIAPSADPSSRVFQVEVTIPNPQDLLKPGMIASVAVPGEESSSESAKQQLVVPLNAIVKPAMSEGYSVFVVVEQDGQEVARRRAVGIGQVYENMIAVTRGVSQGERVIVSGAGLVSDGERVRVIP